MCCCLCLLHRRSTSVVRMHKIIRFTCARCTIIFIHLALLLLLSLSTSHIHRKHTVRFTISRICFQARSRAHTTFPLRDAPKHASYAPIWSVCSFAASRLLASCGEWKGTSQAHQWITHCTKWNRNENGEHSINLDTFVTFCFYLFIESMVGALMVHLNDTLVHRIFRFDLMIIKT